MRLVVEQRNEANTQQMSPSQQSVLALVVVLSCMLDQHDGDN